MDLSQFHFAHPLWLWGWIAIPLVWIIFFLFYQKYHPLHQLEKFIDRHLLPYLLVNHQDRQKSHWKTLLVWSFVWFCLTLALAGPRWNFREMETFSQDQSLIILLDLSESMNATDIKPSRLARAKQKIEDLLHLSQGVKIGLLAFAADSHMITPITDDKETIRHLLPSLETDLIYMQGSQLSPALAMASTMLEAEPGTNKALLVMSDGGFEDGSAIITAKKLAEKGVIIHAMGIGTAEGAPLQNKKAKNHIPILSKLEKEKLQEISKIGNGRYLEAHYSDQEETMILKELQKQADVQMKIGKKNQFWDEHFYLMILPTLPIFLWWFRRGDLFILIFILFTLPSELKAVNLDDYFKNSEQQGKEAFEKGDYEGAADRFHDAYRKGVAYYKANDFAEAEKMFQESSRTEVSSHAAYNLGNALVQQQKLQEAITAYEEVLKKWPDHTKAKENLEIVKKMLEEQKQENSPQSENSDQQENQSENQDRRENQEQNQSDSPKQQREEKQAPKSQEDQDADLWLNRMTHDPKTFLKNKFYIESKQKGTKEGMNPW